MENPWRDLSEHEFVLAADKPHIDAFNLGAAGKHRLDTSVLPQPFLGRRDAPLVVLALNPGRRGWTEGEYAEALREDLHSEEGTAFPALRREFVNDQGQWWKRCLGRVAEAAGLRVSSLAYRVLAIEFLAYHSTSYRAVPITLPSQHFSFHLVREALGRDAVVVVLRGGRSWSVAVPELIDSAAAFSRNPRAGVISAATIGEEGFARAVDAVSSTRGQRTPVDPSSILGRARELGDRFPRADEFELQGHLFALVNEGLTPAEAEMELIRLASRPVPPISDWFI